MPLQLSPSTTLIDSSLAASGLTGFEDHKDKRYMQEEDVLSLDHAGGSTSSSNSTASGLTMEEAKLLYPGLGCGYTNGQELLGYYTMAQTSFVLFMSVMVAMAVCMAWQVAEDELNERGLCSECSIGR